MLIGYLKDGQITHIYRITNSPVTCLGAGATCLYAGAWDKNVYGHDRKPSNPSGLKTFQGHTDFVKALLPIFIGNSPVVVSGSADASLIVWDALSGNKLHQLKGHARGVQTLALEELAADHATIVSGDSSREIRRWYISSGSSYELPITSSGVMPQAGPVEPLIAHETSIYALSFDADGDLWTASADKTAKCLSRNDGFKADTVLQHPDFVRGVAIHEAGGSVVTACRDENIRVWKKGSGKLIHVYEGHFEEVTGVVVDEEGGRAISVSIDGTVRTWGLTPEDIKKAKADAREEEKEVQEEPKKSLLTAEEEAELAELMDDDD